MESVGAALVREDIKGEFDVTPGYKVDAVRINGKKIVSEVKDSTKEILGKIEQNGDKVTISVPESVFNPGKNNFDYDLSKKLMPNKWTKMMNKILLRVTNQLKNKFKFLS